MVKTESAKSNFSTITPELGEFKTCLNLPVTPKWMSMVALNFNKLGGLVPAIAQDGRTGEILMLAFMNQEAWDVTLATGRATYYSRSRKRLWVKGETSGNFQIVKEIRIDCDDDAVVLKVEQVGKAACHTGHRSCFHKQVQDGSIRIIGQPVFDPKEVYKP